MLSRLVEVILPIDFYTDMMGVLVDQHILRDMLSIKDPKLRRHFQNMDLDPTIPSMQWFVTLFANALHFEVSQTHSRWCTRHGTYYSSEALSLCLRLH